jgi:pyruvate/2-oxoglutarate dehydrogenase complex dihydrolipoamide acyltransferase (E2) component
MPRIPIIMPQLGESIAEATIVNFLVKAGDKVSADQDVIEVETNKATMNVTAPCPGVVENFNAKLNESYPVGAVLGCIEASKEDAARLGLDDAPQSETAGKCEVAAADSNGEKAAPKQYRVEPTVRGLPVPASVGGASYMSPRMKARMNELGLHAADLAAWPGAARPGVSRLKILKSSLRTWRKINLAPLPQCELRSPTPCAEVAD